METVLWAAEDLLPGLMAQGQRDWETPGTNSCDLVFLGETSHTVHLSPSLTSSSVTSTGFHLRESEGCGSKSVSHL